MIKYIFALLLFPICLYATDFKGTEKLLERRFPFLMEKVEFRMYSEPAEKEVQEAFRLYSSSGKLVVEAMTESSAACGLNFYLKNYCHRSLSHCGNNLLPLHTLPLPNDTITASTSFSWRYALNYCTYNYTYSFYSWEDWEWELDWMALNGVNLMLAPMGTEIIWQKMLTALEFRDEEIRAFLPGPAFNAWWLMGNLEGWGGPVSDRLIEQWKNMQQRILERMKELGITPILQGFWGMVPERLQEKYPDAQIIGQGTWAGGFHRPAVLLPDDPLFDRMASLYYDQMKEYYGEDIRFLGGDLFHEGGNTEGLHITQIARKVQDNMQKHFPGVTWVLQGWGGNPRKTLLDGLNPEQTLVIDLFGETSRNWEKTHEYNGFPWIWSSVNNFGGKVGMGAQLPVLVEEPHRAYAYSTGKHLKGIGITPEGIDANAIAYDWALQTAWSQPETSVDAYLRKYILYRYGSWNQDLFDAWTLLLGSVYGDYRRKGEGTFESIFCARPGLQITHVSTWGPSEIQYDTAPLEEALKMFRKAAPSFIDHPTYQYDLTDLARQVNANRARRIYAGAIDAFRRKDRKALAQQSRLFLTLLKQQDALLNTNTLFMVGTWIERAKQYGKGNPYDVRLCEWNARTQISYWGPDNPHTDLHDYAHKEWGGILADLYLQRWTLFFTDLEKQLEGNSPAQIDYYNLEKKWAEGTDIYPIKPTGDYLKEVDKI